MPLFNKKSQMSAYWDERAKEYLAEDFRDGAETREYNAIDEESFVTERLKLTKEILRTQRLIWSPLANLTAYAIHRRNLHNHKVYMSNFFTILFSTYKSWMDTLEELPAGSATRKKFLEKLQKGMKNLRKKLEADLKRNSEAFRSEVMVDMLISLSGKIMELDAKMDDFVKRAKRRNVKNGFDYSPL